MSAKLTSPCGCPTLRRAGIFAGLALLTVLLLGGANSNQPAPAASSPMEEPIRLISEARKSFQGVKDYTCVFVKREFLNGALQPENQVALKVRNQPFSVHLKWLSPKGQVGQEASYVAGKNNGMMRAKSPGVLGAIGWMTVDPNDPRVKQNSRHPITEAGIGNLIERFALRWETERKLGLTQVKVSEYEFAKRRCTRVETIHPDNSGKQFTTYRTVLYFDKENNLPIRIENYDWPKTGGSPDGELLESYSYVNLKFNVGLGDDSFNQ